MYEFKFTTHNSNKFRPRASNEDADDVAVTDDFDVDVVTGLTVVDFW